MRHKRLLLWCLRRYESVTCTVHFIRYFLGFEYVVKYCYRLHTSATYHDPTRLSVSPRIYRPHPHYNPLLF